MSNAVQSLTRQLPDYFKPILEYQEIMKAHGYAMDDFDFASQQVWANNYIATCDEPTIAFWEHLLGIVYRFGDTMDFRRDRVLQKFNTIVPFSIGFLNAKLTELFGADGYELEVNSEDCTISVRVTSDRYGAVDLLYDLLWDIIPAHLKIIANQETTNFVGGSSLYAAGFVASTMIQTIGGNNGTI